MQPTQELIDYIYRQKVEAARAMAADVIRDRPIE